MVEKLFLPVIVAGDLLVEPGVRSTEAFAREKYLLWRATSLSVESALRFAADMPVGAVAATHDEITGAFFASDARTSFNYMHAEERAVAYSRFHGYRHPDTVAVTLEPCNQCQDGLSGCSPIKTVAFVLSREDVANKGLVNPRPGIFDRVESQNDLPFEVLQITEPRITEVNHIILDNVFRDIETGEVSVDGARLRGQLLEQPGIAQHPALSQII